MKFSFLLLAVQWLSVPSAPVATESDKAAQRAADGTSWFATTVTNAADVVSARWTVAGLGVFEVYVNGRRVGNDFLKPGFTSADKTKYAFAYDVTALMNVGKGEANVLSAAVSSGWWRDKIIGYVGRKSAFRGELAVTLADGTTRTFGTNVRGWTCGIAAQGGCLTTGFLGTSFLMDALTENGMADVACDLLLNHKFPSWLYSVDQGATTVWERWNSYTKKDGFGPVERPV